jgi:hypothetical protein
MKYTCPKMVPVLSMLCFEGQDHSGGRGQHSRIIERKYYSFYRKTGNTTSADIGIDVIGSCKSNYHTIKPIAPGHFSIHCQ